MILYLGIYVSKSPGLGLECGIHYTCIAYATQHHSVLHGDGVGKQQGMYVYNVSESFKLGFFKAHRLFRIVFNVCFLHTVYTFHTNL